LKHNYTYTYKRVHLRPLEERDIEELRILRNKNQQYFNNTAQITPEQQKAWFEKYLAREDDCMFAIELASKPGEFIGAVAFYNIDWEAGITEAGRTIIDKEKVTEKGIGSEMALTHAYIAYNLMGLKEIRLTVHKDNERAIRMNRRTGCEITGECGDEFCMVGVKERFVLPD